MKTLDTTYRQVSSDRAPASKAPEAVSIRGASGLRVSVPVAVIVGALGALGSYFATRQPSADLSAQVQREADKAEAFREEVRQNFTALREAQIRENSTVSNRITVLEARAANHP